MAVQLSVAGQTGPNCGLTEHPRAASSWFIRSPTWAPSGYVRGVLLELQAGKARMEGPVPDFDAIAFSTGDPGLMPTYPRQGWTGALRLREGRGNGLLGAWNTIKECDPNRIAGFSPIPAISMANPQIFSHQSDVPGPGGWWWIDLPGHVRLERVVDPASDTHRMVETRQQGHGGSFGAGYADSTNFDYDWPPALARIDAAPPMPHAGRCRTASSGFLQAHLLMAVMVTVV